MDAEVSESLEKIDFIIKKLGSDKAEDVSDYLGYTIVSTNGNLIGYITKQKNMVFIGVNERLSYVKRMFDLWHEIGHGISGHLDEQGFTNQLGYHLEASLAASSLRSRTISRQERVANTIAADYCIDTDTILRMTGYNNTSVQQFRRLKAAQLHLRQEYNGLLLCLHGSGTSSQKAQLNEYRNELRRLDEKQMELGRDIAESGIKSVPEMAKALHTSSIIIEYKLEALRIRGYDVETNELATYDKVFRQETL